MSQLYYMKHWTRLSAGLPLALAVLIAGLNVPHASKLQQANTGGAALLDERWVMQPLRPLSLRVERTLYPIERDRNTLIGISVKEIDVKEIDRNLRPLSRLRFFDAAGLSADWKYGGQIQYRFEGVRPLGGSVGGRLSSNSVKITLSWSGQN
jgi:hypothetical protein